MKAPPKWMVFTFSKHVRLEEAFQLAPVQLPTLSFCSVDEDQPGSLEKCHVT